MFFLNKKNPTHSRGIWVVGWKIPKGFLISTTFRGYTSNFRFGHFYIVDFHSALNFQVSVWKRCLGGTPYYSSTKQLRTTTQSSTHYLSTKLLRTTNQRSMSFVLWKYTYVAKFRKGKQNILTLKQIKEMQEITTQLFSMTEHTHILDSALNWTRFT